MASATMTSTARMADTATFGADLARADDAPLAPRLLFEEASAALNEGRFVPYYQPMLNLASGRIIGFEALARWNHPTRGVLEPSSFLGVFGDRHLSVAIGQHMLARVGADVMAWERAGTVIEGISLNVSNQELRQGTFAKNLDALLKTVGLSPRRLTIEVTHGVDFADPDSAALAQVRKLHELGVTISLDDFGTGFASLTQLRQIPADCLKIDRSFVQRIEDDPDDAALVAGLIGLAHRLGMKTVAEGVETPAQLAYLQAESCDFAQGYLLGRPMPAAAVPHFTAGATSGWSR